MKRAPDRERDDELGTLLAASATGDVEAFRALYERTSARLFAIALRIAHRPEVAEDVIQDAYVTMWTKAVQQSHGGGSAFAWMATIVRHRAIDAMRARREELRDFSAQELEDDTGLTVEDDVLQQASSEAVRRCIGALEESPRRAIMLAYYRGCSHEELASQLDAPLGTVKSWIRRGLIRLRRCLER